MHLNQRYEIVDAETVMKQIWDYVKSGKPSESAVKPSVSGVPPREFDFSELENNKAMVNRVWHIQVEKLITSQRKLIGKLIVFGKKVIRKFSRWYIVPLFEQQVNFNGAVTRCLNEIYNFTRFTEGKNKADQLELESRLKAEFYSRIEVLSEENESLAGRLFYLNQLVDQRRNENIAALSELDLRHKVTREYHESLSNQVLELNSKFATANVDLGNRLAGETACFQQKLFELNWKIRRLERQTRKNKIVQADSESSQPAGQTGNCSPDPWELDYFLFEQRFRGTIEDIKNRQRIYVDFFQGKTNVLDIGCGRGELVELLLEEGVPAQGIDLNNDMVEYCQDKGLPVERSDAVTYLTALPDASLGGVYVGQVVEHLSQDYLLQLVELIYTKLKAGCYLIIETPNPLNLGIFASFFYQDLTHQKPVHPLTLEFILEGLGFRDIELKFQAPVQDEHKLKLISSSPENDANLETVQTCNENIGKLNNLLFGNQDYAIIAHK